MGYMKDIDLQIKELYPNDPKKQKELREDFRNWVNGVYWVPLTKEIRDIVLKKEKGNV